jgi:NADH:ubiquinone oxidoreductase subunit
MDLINRIFIKFSSQKIGDDEFGNQYFQNKNGKRFVIYKGIPEPSKVPFEWHGWLHHSTNIAPVNIDTHKYSWQKIHLPNLTGTKNSYSPKNSLEPKTSATYEAWKPDSK